MKEIELCGWCLKDSLKMWMRLKEVDGVNLHIKKLDKMRETTQSRKWGNLKGSEGTPSIGLQVFWLVYNILYDKPMAQETFHIWNSTVHGACIFVVIVGWSCCLYSYIFCSLAEKLVLFLSLKNKIVAWFCFLLPFYLISHDFVVISFATF